MALMYKGNRLVSQVELNLSIKRVEELPLTGEPFTLYLVLNNELNNELYDAYLFQNLWVKVASATVDASGIVKFEFAS